MAMKSNERGFGSRLGMILASAGSAVGLGNLLFVTGRVSAYGALFFIPYTILMILMGLPLMSGEFALGRKKQQAALQATEDAPSVGWFGVLGAFLVMSFYFILGGAVIMTVIFSVTAETSTEIADYLFSIFSTGEGVQMNMIGLSAATLAFLGLNWFILKQGVSDGIEKISKIAMPALLITLVGLAIYAIVAGEHNADLVNLFTKWNFDEATDPNGYGGVLGVVSAAAAKAFLSLSVGLAIMVIYGSYMKKEDDIISNSFWTILMDWSVVVIASISTIALGSWFAMPPMAVALLMVLVLVAALTSSLSLIEGVGVGVGDKFGADRSKSIDGAIIVMVLVSILGLGLMATGTTSWVTAIDAFSEGYVFLMGGFFLSLYLGWRAQPWDEIDGNTSFFTRVYFPFMTKFFIPALLLFLWCYQVGVVDLFTA